jgi:KDO2-lipid IV(A) lauroyltransferase
MGEIAVRVVPKKIAYSVASAFAGAYSLVPTLDRLRVEDNQRAVLGALTSGDLVRKNARELIRNFSRYLVDFHYDADFSPAFIRKNVRFTGLDHLDRALDGKKGVLLASAHFGNWELAGVTLAELGYKIHALALAHRDAGVDRIFRRRREKHGFHVMPVGGYHRELYRILSRNEILGMNVDRHFTGEAVEVSFFARRVKFPVGLAKLSAVTGAPMLTGFFVPEGYGRFLFEIQEPLRGKSAAAVVQDYASRLEVAIRRHPTQWFIFQRFWEKAEWPV